MNNKGFTMVELLVAMAIMGLLIVMAFPTMRAIQTNNTKKKYEAYGDTAVSAAKLYVDSYGDDLFDPDRVNQKAIIYFNDLKLKDLIKDINISDSSCINGQSNIKVIKYDNDITYCLHLTCKTGTKTVYEKESKTGACKNFASTNVNYTYNGVTNTIEIVSGDDKYKVLSPSQVGFDMAENHDTFDHWEVNSTPIKPGEFYNHPITSDITFVAKTTKWKYHINFKKNSDATYGGAMDQQTCTYGQKCELTNNAFTRTGYHFKHWQKDSSTTFNNHVDVKTSLGNTITYDGQQFNLTGIFDINKCTITYSPNGGTFGTHQNDLTQTINYGSYMGDNPEVNGMRNANGGYYTATRTNYHVDAADAWKSGSNTFDERKSYLAQNVCDLSSGDNSITLNVNWKISRPTCTITVSNSPTAGKNGWYTSNVDIKLNTNGIIENKGLATTANSTNDRTSATISSEGSVTYYGYVSNSAGNGSCQLTIKLDKSAPSCTSSGGSSTWTANGTTLYKWVANSQKISGACSDSVSGVVSATVETTKSIKSGESGTINGNYSPGTCENGAGLKTNCSNVKVKVTGTTIKDYQSGAVFMFDGKTGLSDTKWNDQSGNGNHGTLQTETSKSGNSVWCTGNPTEKNSYIRLSKFNYRNVTLEAVFKSGLSSSDSDWHAVVGNQQLGGYAIVATGSQSNFWIWKGEDYVYTPLRATGSDMAYVSGAGNDSMVKSLVNGGNYYYKSDSNKVKFPDYDEPIVICANPFYKYEAIVDMEYFRGNVYAARMYGSVLSDDQMQKHYVIDRARFS